MVALARFELDGREPMRRDDPFVELAIFVQSAGIAGEAEAKECDVLGRVVPAVHTDQRARLEVVRRLLEHLATASGTKRLARVQVAGRLVEHPAAVDPLLDQKEPAAALDYR